jgi:2-polyprenyl-6-methoxyphenol hydroxylase-like FAD-dependent oxidoreductase
MMRIVIVGSGPAGMTAALLLARDGHQVTLVDRDPGPSGHGEWHRIGVMQFHLPQGLRAQGRFAIAERLPDVHAALIEAGGLLFAPPGAPESAAGMRIRRSTLERTMWRCVDRQPRIKRYTGHADELVVAGGAAVGVTVDGVFAPADLVIDATGKAGRLTLAHRPAAEEADCGIAYAAREYQLLAGAEPGPLNGGPGYAAEHDGFLEFIFPQDAGVFQALLVRGTRDNDLALLREAPAFEAAVQVLPGCAAWTRPERARAVGPVRAGAGLVNRYRPQARGLTGLLAIGDAAMTTNPAAARGLSFAILAGCQVAGIVAGHPRRQWARLLGQWCDTELRPWFSDHVLWDAHMTALWSGAPIDPDGEIPSVLVGAAAAQHPDWLPAFRAYLAMEAKPGSLDPLRAEVRAMLRAGWRPAPPAGASRADLVHAIRQASDWPGGIRRPGSQLSDRIPAQIPLSTPFQRGKTGGPNIQTSGMRT